MNAYLTTRRKAVVCIVLSGTACGLIGPSLAEAALGACRSDPIVQLSDGVRVQLYSDIYDSPANVKGVAYVLHAPVGIKVISISYPSDMATAIPETFQLVADSRDAKYHTTTYVTDANGKVRVVTYGVATGPTGVVSKTVKHNGRANRLVKLDLKLPK